MTREERLALWDKLYDEPGFGIWLAQFPRDLHRRGGQCRILRIHRRSHPPPRQGSQVAEKLIPKDHGFGVQRVPLETQLFRGLQPRQRASGRHQRDADRSRHREGPAHHRARLRIRHHRLRHRLRRHHRRLRPDRHPAASAARSCATNGATARRPSSACWSTAFRTC